MNEDRHNEPTGNDPLNVALAAIIKNTRTTRRHLSLPDIVHWIDVATKELGSLPIVADRVGLSTTMLRQFLSVKELTPTVQQLFEEKRIDSVDAAAHLRMLSPEEQEFIGNATAQGDINTADIRAVCEFRKAHPKTPITDVLERVKATRNIKHYVVEFVPRGKTPDITDLERRFDAALGEDGIVSLEVVGAIGTLILNQSGRTQLQKLARTNRITQAEAVTRIVGGEFLE